MICQVGDRTYEGRAVSVTRDVDPDRVAAAVRHGDERSGEPPIVVEAADTGPLHEYVGCIHPDASFRPRTALAVAGRSRGWRTSVDDDLARVRERLAEWPGVEVPRDAAARATVADRAGAVERLRERVAAERGRATAGDGTADIEAAVRKLSEAETVLAAARERQETTRESARAARDRLRERLRLRDRASNLERAARRELVDRARSDYRRALRSVPGVDRVRQVFNAPPDAMALAVARVGSLSAPVVIGTGRFDDAAEAADWIDAPVIYL